MEPCLSVKEQPVVEAGSQELVNGIFSLVVTWVKSLEENGSDEETARNTVANYLDGVSYALKNLTSTETQSENT